MRAVILAGGEATRLRPLTCNTPKAMVPVLNKPFLERVLTWLVGHGIRDVILALGHLPHPVKDYFGDGSRFGVRLIHEIEDKQMGTAGAVKNAEKLLDKRFIVLNGDTYTDLDLGAMIAFHERKKAKLTISVASVEDPSAYGLVAADADSKITSFLEKPSHEQITIDTVNSGTYIMEADVLSYIPPVTKFSFERQVFPKLLEDGVPLYAFHSPGYWIDIGTPEKYLQLHRDLLARKTQSLAPAKGVELGVNCKVSPHSVITGSAVIGDGCIVEKVARITGPVSIGSGCFVGDGAIIEDSVIWQKVSIGAGSIVRGSVVANNCVIGAGGLVEDAVLGDYVTIPPGKKLAPRSKIFPGICLDSE